MESARITSRNGSQIAVVESVRVFEGLELTAVHRGAGYISGDVIFDRTRYRPCGISGISVSCRAGYVPAIIRSGKIGIIITALPLPVEASPVTGLVESPLGAFPIAILLILLKRIVGRLVHDDVRTRSQIGRAHV